MALMLPRISKLTTSPLSNPSIILLVIATVLNGSTPLSSKCSCGVSEAFLLLISQVREAVQQIFATVDLCCPSVDSLVLSNGKSPVQSHQSNADTVANNHGGEATDVLWCLRGSECLWPNKITDSISDVENREHDSLFGVACSVCLRKRDT